MLTQVSPIMPVRALDAAEDFYHRLGFRTVARYDADGYLILAHDTVALHFYRDPGHVPERSNHGAYLDVVDAAAWSAELSALALPAAGIPRFHPAEDKPWGMHELAVIDPDGNLLRAGTRIAEASDG